MANYLKLPREEKDFLKITDLFVKLSAMWTLQRVFGDEFYATLSQEYRTTSMEELDRITNSEEKIQEMIRKMSKITNRNLSIYFDYWGIKVSEETLAYCEKLPALEKEIWLDIAGYPDRYELLDVLPAYTIPTGTPIDKNLSLFSNETPVTNIYSVPKNSEINSKIIEYRDIGSKEKAVIKITNENRVSNIIPITGEVLGGDAIKFRGNTSAYQIMVPNPEKKLFSVIGKGQNLHQSAWNGAEYVSVTQYNSSLNKIKKQVVINGVGENSDSSYIKKEFDNLRYEVGDYIRINHIESDSRLDRYKNNQLLSKDKRRIYWYIMTDTGWEETSPDLGIKKKEATFLLGKVIKPEDIIDIPAGLETDISQIVLKKAPDLSNVGQKTAEVVVKTKLGIEQSVIVDNINIIGGNAIKFRGNTSAYQILMPDSSKRTFSVVGKGKNFHQSAWRDEEYMSIIHYDESLNKVKRQLTVNGIGVESDSSKIQEIFNNQPYSIGDYVRINHVESEIRLDRFQNDILLPKNRAKIYWYRMTKSGWELLSQEPPRGRVTINDYYYGKREITGQFSGEIKRAKLFINEKLISQGGTFEKGLFNYYVGIGRIGINDSVRLEFVDFNGKIIEKYSVEPMVSSENEGIQNASYMLSTNEIKANFKGNLKYARLIINNEVVSVGGTLLENSELSYYVNRAKITSKSKVSLQGYNEKNQPIGKPTTVKLIDFNVNIQSASYMLKDQWITGKYEGDIKKARLTVKGKVISSGGTFNKDGTFKYYIKKSLVEKETQAFLEIYDS
ncbi:hypothetical protein HFX86_002546, partial [Enterococcus faecalis]|nr:hypothetical protein [Enterococcus faecalis]